MPKTQSLHLPAYSTALPVSSLVGNK
jgi:hypothetical protein